MDRKELSKKYRILYDTNSYIINNDYLNEQVGYTYPAINILSEEFNTKKELEKFVSDNKLSLKLKRLNLYPFGPISN